MKRIISNTLLEKDRPNVIGKERLYYVKFFNELEMYLVGLSIQDCIDKYELKYSIKRFHLIESWNDLLQKEKTIISTEVDAYRRTCITLPNFRCYYDEWSKSYYIINNSTNDKFILK